ncbi:transcriptional regulator [Cupriavidus sp. USMAA2-4]|uniref:Transcriptional regulator n=1 Tax=Cupriavidus malaysiensis TaxID=367825 RepID=A0ABM6FGC2_9BURK|nr:MULTISPECIES: LysR family transcriptional regulator [Cupriavidus]AOY97385.1 transcriptional regulator [Cupriavidus sp. USMAA2-4]AOZ04012.1 transcriptional regulator [Cupriavidus sp. USMAHM13]AOZ10918.1 transcriptional regulator [Cupriavidus malaysiensis]
MNPNELFALLPDMAVFARVVDAGNFSLAARQLGTTPSTVSRQIKRLEDALATRLLERSTRKVRVTASGEQVYRHCRELVGAAAGAVDAAGALAARPAGRVSLSAPTAYAKTVIHPLVPDFLRACPDVDLRLVFSDATLDPLDDDLDLVIRLTDQPPPGLAGRRLGRVEWVLCASRAYLAARGEPRHPRELAAHDCLFLGETADDKRWRFRRTAPAEAAAPVSVEVRGRYAANHASARLEAAQQGLGIASLPDFAAAQALQRGEVVRVLADWTLEARAYVGTVWLLHPPNRFLPPKVRALIDFLDARLRAPR